MFSSYWARGSRCRICPYGPWPPCHLWPHHSLCMWLAKNNTRLFCLCCAPMDWSTSWDRACGLLVALPHIFNPWPRLFSLLSIPTLRSDAQPEMTKSPRVKMWIHVHWEFNTKGNLHYSISLFAICITFDTSIGSLYLLSAGIYAI